MKYITSHYLYDNYLKKLDFDNKYDYNNNIIPKDEY